MDYPTKIFQKPHLKIKTKKFYWNPVLFIQVWMFGVYYHVRFHRYLKLALQVLTFMEVTILDNWKGPTDSSTNLKICFHFPAHTTGPYAVHMLWMIAWVLEIKIYETFSYTTARKSTVFLRIQCAYCIFFFSEKLRILIE